MGTSRRSASVHESALLRRQELSEARRVENRDRIRTVVRKQNVIAGADGQLAREAPHGNFSDDAFPRCVDYDQFSRRGAADAKAVRHSDEYVSAVLSDGDGDRI